MGYGKKIRDYRKARGLTQGELAKELGYEHGIISQHERESAKPSIAFLEKVATKMEKSIEWLMEPATAPDYGSGEWVPNPLKDNAVSASNSPTPQSAERSMSLSKADSMAAITWLMSQNKNITGLSERAIDSDLSEEAIKLISDAYAVERRRRKKAEEEKRARNRAQKDAQTNQKN